MTNFDYYTSNRAALAMLIDQFMTKPAKCQFCVARDLPACPVHAPCILNIMRWLRQEREEEKQNRNILGDTQNVVL